MIQTRLDCWTEWTVGPPLLCTTQALGMGNHISSILSSIQNVIKHLYLAIYWAIYWIHNASCLFFASLKSTIFVHTRAIWVAKAL